MCLKSWTMVQPSLLDLQSSQLWPVWQSLECGRTAKKLWPLQFFVEGWDMRWRELGSWCKFREMQKELIKRMYWFWKQCSKEGRYQVTLLPCSHGQPVWDHDFQGWQATKRCHVEGQVPGEANAAGTPVPSCDMVRLVHWLGLFGGLLQGNWGSLG